MAAKEPYSPRFVGFQGIERQKGDNRKGIYFAEILGARIPFTNKRVAGKLDFIDTPQQYYATRLIRDMWGHPGFAPDIDPKAAHDDPNASVIGYPGLTRSRVQALSALCGEHAAREYSPEKKLEIYNLFNDALKDAEGRLPNMFEAIKNSDATCGTKIAPEVTDANHFERGANKGGYTISANVPNLLRGVKYRADTSYVYEPKKTFRKVTLDALQTGVDNVGDSGGGAVGFVFGFLPVIAVVGPLAMIFRKAKGDYIDTTTVAKIDLLSQVNGLSKAMGMPVSGDGGQDGPQSDLDRRPPGNRDRRDDGNRGPEGPDGGPGNSGAGAGDARSDRMESSKIRPEPVVLAEAMGPRPEYSPQSAPVRETPAIAAEQAALASGKLVSIESSPKHRKAEDLSANTSAVNHPIAVGGRLASAAASSPVDEISNSAESTVRASNVVTMPVRGTNMGSASETPQRRASGKR